MEGFRVLGAWGFCGDFRCFLGMNGMGKLMEIEIQSLATADLSLVTHRVKSRTESMVTLRSPFCGYNTT